MLNASDACQRPDVPGFRIEFVEPGIALITLDDPDRLNALTRSAASALADRLRTLGRNQEVRAVILTGEGRGFCAGYALEEFEGLVSGGVETEVGYEIQQAFADLVLAIAEVPKPVIAAVNGVASGGGLAIALAADTRVCSESARFHTAFVRLGLSGCDVGVSYHLPRIIGPTRAFEMMMSARIVDAAEAVRAALVLEVVPDGEVVKAATQIARNIARHSAFGVTLTKRVMRANLDAPSLAHAVLTENHTQVMCTTTPGFAEGVASIVGSSRRG